MVVSSRSAIGAPFYETADSSASGVLVRQFSGTSREGLCKSTTARRAGDPNLSDGGLQRRAPILELAASALDVARRHRIALVACELLLDLLEFS